MECSIRTANALSKEVLKFMKYMVWTFQHISMQSTSKYKFFLSSNSRCYSFTTPLISFANLPFVCMNQIKYKITPAVFARNSQAHLLLLVQISASVVFGFTKEIPSLHTGSNAASPALPALTSHYCQQCFILLDFDLQPSTNRSRLAM